MKLHLILKNIRYRRSWLEYFYWIFLIIFIAVSVLGASLYLYFSSLLKNEAVLQNNNTLTQLKNAQEAVLAETDRAISSIVMDSIIGNYMDYYNAQDTLLMMAAQNTLDNVESLNDSVDSIYVWYIDSNIILSSDQGAVRFENYDDAAFLKSITQFKVRQNYSRIKNDSLNNRNISIVSFVSAIPIYVTTGKPKALVVFNLKSEALQQTVDSIKLSDRSSILITDQVGKIISQKVGNSDMTDSQVVKEINKFGEQQSGSFVMDVYGENSLVSFMNSDRYDWRYMYITPMSDITKGIRFLGVITILFCSLIMALGLFGSLLLSRKLYSPIQSALAKFSTGSAENQEKVKDTELLQSSIDKMLRKNKSLEELLKDYDSIRRNDFLLNLLELAAEPGERLSERLEYYHLNLDTEGWFVTFIISIDNSQKVCDQYSEKQINMLLLYIRENISDKLFPDYKGFLTEKSNGDFFLTINFPFSSTMEQMKEVSCQTAVLVQSLVSRNMKFTFTIGVSMPCSTIQKLHEGYEQAEMAVNQRLLIGYSHIIYYENLVSKSNDVVDYPFSVEKQILNGIKTGNQEDILKLLNNFKDHIAEIRKEDIELIRYYFLQLLTASVKCFYEIDRSFGTEFMQKEYYAAILKLGTIHEMTILMKNLYTDFLNFMDVLRNTKNRERNREMIQCVGDFVSGNLAQDLSLELLAEKFMVSTYQLRKIFKDELGILPKDFIDDIKMRKAAELLTTTSLKIGSIAEQVGYFSIPSFTHAFKMSKGRTPGEYRQENSKKHTE